MTLQIVKTPTQPTPAHSTSSLVESLRVEDQKEVVTFLSRRSEHTFVMAGLIRDNGLISPLNRGTFYGHRNADGTLDGVALIGHITVFETSTEAALSAFARLSQDCSSVHAVIGETAQVGRFLSYYKENGQRPRLLCREEVFEQRHCQSHAEPISGLRLATLADLDLVAPVHAQMAFEECGVNPLFVDSEGFYRRCARRIEQGRVWVKSENNQLVFKADIVSETPEVIYLEGIYVGAESRGKGFGARCLKQLTNELLKSTESVCLLVNEQNTAARACYQKAGYRMRELYDTLYFPPVQDPSIH